MRAVCQSPFFTGDPDPAHLATTKRCPYWARYGLWLDDGDALKPTPPHAVCCGVHRNVLTRWWGDTLDIRALTVNA